MRATHGSYSAWSGWLEAFARGEDLPSAHLVALDELGPHMTERVLGAAVSALTARAQTWAQTTGRHIGSVTTPVELAAALVAGRTRFRPLHALASDPRLPQEARDRMCDSLREMLQSTDVGLETDIRRRRPRDADAFVTALRENRLAAVMSRPAQAAWNAPQSWNAPPPSPPTGRRVIL